MDKWNGMPFPEIYDVLGDAPKLTIGQLTESWEDLLRTDASVQWELVWLGDVLKAIGHLA